MSESVATQLAVRGARLERLGSPEPAGASLPWAAKAGRALDELLDTADVVLAATLTALFNASRR